MASTNKTKNYELSQFIQTDKPTFLGDYNSDMNKIDDALKENNNISLNASTSIGDLNNLTTENKLNLVNAINEVNEKVNTADTNITENTNNIADLETKVNKLTGEILFEGNFDYKSFEDKLTFSKSTTEFDYLEIYHSKYGIFKVKPKGNISINNLSTFTGGNNSMTSIIEQALISLTDTTLVGLLCGYLETTCTSVNGEPSGTPTFKYVTINELTQNNYEFSTITKVIGYKLV